MSPLGKVIIHTYDASGREISVTDPMGNRSTTQYFVAQQGGSNSIAKTNPLGYSEIVLYDELGRPLAVKDNGGNANAERIIMSSTYSLNGQVASKTDRFGNKVTNYYDEFNRLVKSIDSLDNISTMSYDDANLKTTSYLNGVKKSEEIKDTAGNSLSATSYASDGQYVATITKYNGLKQKLQTSSFVNDKLDTVIKYSYNGDGDAISTTTTTERNDSSKAKIIADRKYDLLGNSLSQETTVSGKGIILGNINTYNQVGKLVSTTNPLGQSRSMSYDADGELANVKDYNGVITSYSYNGNGNIISETTSGITTSYTYDAIGHVLTVSRLGKTVSYSYTNNGLLMKVNYPDGKSVIYTYNNEDLPNSKTNVFGFRTTYDYDKGRISLISSSQGNISYIYADNTAINSAYGMLTGYSLMVGGKAMLSHSYSYDSWNQLNQDSIRQNAHNIIINITRNLYRQISQQTISSDLPDPSLNSVKEFDYDALNHLVGSRASYKELGGKISQISEQFSYDKNGNVLTYDRNGVATHYSYNTIDQLISVNDKEVSYDAAGNMLIDPDGNQYSYNELNELIGVTNGQQATSYNYYPDGMLQTKTTAKKSIVFYYDNGHADGISSTQDGLATKEDSFLLSADGEPLASYRNNIANYYLKAGNSTIGLFDTQGNLINSYKYDAYGSTTSSHPTDSTQSFLWDQEYTDPDTNLVYLRARFYSPKLMRFINADTVNVSNIYNFGEGNPINNIDPSGHFSEKEWVQFGIGFAQLIAGIAMTAFSVATSGVGTPVAVAGEAAAAGAAGAAEAAVVASTSIGGMVKEGLGMAGIAVVEQLGVSGVQATIEHDLGLKVDQSDYTQAGVAAAVAGVLGFVGTLVGGTYRAIKVSSAVDNGIERVATDGMAASSASLVPRERRELLFSFFIDLKNRARSCFNCALNFGYFNVGTEAEARNLAKRMMISAKADAMRGRRTAATFAGLERTQNILVTQGYGDFYAHQELGRADLLGRVNDFQSSSNSFAIQRPRSQRSFLQSVLLYLSPKK